MSNALNTWCFGNLFPKQIMSLTMRFGNKFPKHHFNYVKCAYDNFRVDDINENAGCFDTRLTIS